MIQPLILCIIVGDYIILSAIVLSLEIHDLLDKFIDEIRHMLSQHIDQGRFFKLLIFNHWRKGTLAGIFWDKLKYISTDDKEKYPGCKIKEIG